ncbi:unnamed protein product [Heligmosomoides polygyrus]|uniref:CRF domain-containing protein n=1 Tax=Heligmosomoides polygyrus TaxID=6339 RepID=A0A3P8CVA4_HELPZ|nr:unnamed protein product [Heligmosomoides polygyrus]
MTSILLVASLNLLILRANAYLITDDGKATKSFYDAPLSDSNEPPNNRSPTQTKEHSGRGKPEKWITMHPVAHPSPAVRRRSKAAATNSAYRTDTDVRRAIRPTSVFSLSPKWNSLSDSGISLSPDMPPSRSITSDPEITLQINQTPVLLARTDQPTRTGLQHNVPRNPREKLKGASGDFKTSSSYKGVWIDKETSLTKAKPITVRNVRDDIRELKYEIRLMKTIIEKLARSNYMHSNTSSKPFSKKNLKDSRSLRLMASRLTARQMIDRHTADGRTRRAGT